MYPVEQIHPMIVHFPIALLITSVIFGILSRITNIERLSYSAHYLMIFGVISGFIAIISGYIAFSKVVDVYKGVEDIALGHGALAAIVIIFFTMRLIMRGEIKWQQLGKGNISDLVFSIIGIVLLLWIAYSGGKMVYEHGAAVNKKIIKDAYIYK